MTEVFERTSAYLTVTFRDKTGAAVSPSSVNYRIDCLTTGAAVRGLTGITPGASVEITLDADDNAVQVAANVREIRRVTVSATYGAGDEVNAQYDYEIVNLSHHP